MLQASNKPLKVSNQIIQPTNLVSPFYKLPNILITTLFAIAIGAANTTIAADETVVLELQAKSSNKCLSAKGKKNIKQENCKGKKRQQWQVNVLEGDLKGEQGERGKRGKKGKKGDTGAQGIQGEKGEQGIAGVDGTNGTNGINGQDGATGEQGNKGDTGAQGIQGIAGVQGERGDVGEQGIQGIAGVDGTNGTNGTNGQDGANGSDGDSFFTQIGADATLDNNTNLVTTGDSYIQVGNSTASCDANNEGAMRYNSSIKSMQFCDATAWHSFASSEALVASTANAFEKFTSSGTWDWAAAGSPSEVYLIVAGAGGGKQTIQYQSDITEICAICQGGSGGITHEVVQVSGNLAIVVGSAGTNGIYGTNFGTNDGASTAGESSSAGSTFALGGARGSANSQGCVGNLVCLTPTSGSIINTSALEIEATTKLNISVSPAAPRTAGYVYVLWRR